LQACQLHDASLLVHKITLPDLHLHVPHNVLTQGLNLEASKTPIKETSARHESIVTLHQACSHSNKLPASCSGSSVVHAVLSMSLSKFPAQLIDDFQSYCVLFQHSHTIVPSAKALGMTHDVSDWQG